MLIPQDHRLRMIHHRVYAESPELGRELVDLLMEFEACGGLLTDDGSVVRVTILDFVRSLRESHEILANVATEKTWQKYLTQVKHGKIVFETESPRSSKRVPTRRKTSGTRATGTRRNARRK